MVGFTEVNPDKGTKTLVLSHKNIVIVLSHKNIVIAKYMYS